MYRLKFEACGWAAEEVYRDQALANIASGIPTIQPRPSHDRPLAVVGGGPSASKELETLKEWKGDIWAVNQGATWLSHHAPKVPVWMFTVDPDPLLADWVAGVQHAIVGSSVSPKLVEALAGKDIAMFHTHELPGIDTYNWGGPSSVCRTFFPALWLGYHDITYFGCEGSFEGSTHAYRSEVRPNQFIIKAGDKDFVTTPDYYMTTEYLAGVMREYPEVMKEKSGGLLRGMLENWDTWEVVALSTQMRDRLDPTAKELYQRVA